MTTKFQPTLPAEVQFSDQELNFMDESPPGLFPENQNSNFGFLIRKIFSDQLKLVAGQQDTLYKERFVSTSTEFLDVWEHDVGLPVNPAGKTIDQRRAEVINRLTKGPFTRPRRAALIEKYVTATFGVVPQLSVVGLSIGSGIVLHSGVNSLTGTYNIVENITDFSYQVRIRQDITVDTTSMLRELTRLTPSGINFTIVAVRDPFVVSSGALTVSGNEITDAVRTAAVVGDGRTPPDSSFGIWEGTTNILPNGGFETDVSGWGSAGCVMTRDTTVAKFGVASARITISTVNASIATISSAISGATTGRKFTASAWVFCPAGAVGKSLRLQVNEGGGTTAEEGMASSDYVLVAGWQKMVVTGTVVRNDRTSIPVYLVFLGASWTAGVIINIDGLQLEEKKFVTPWISSSRSAARVQVPLSFINPRQGWFAARVRPGWNAADYSAARLFITGDVSNFNYLYMMQNGGNLYLGRKGPVGVEVGVNQAWVPVKDTIYTVAGCWTPTQLMVSLNGAAFTTVPHTDFPSAGAMTYADIGSQSAAAVFNGDFLWAMFGAGVISQADVSALVARGNTDPYFSDVSAAAQVGGIFYFDDNTIRIPG
jgi:hypothetical protein